jgi:hypothetical protein
VTCPVAGSLTEDEADEALGILTESIAVTDEEMSR